ncbi:DUF5686 and carboxypeptidase-like regulatory domain-containing protein [Mucilaginibacter psychrotolerans]|uniref:Carboxypeptidase-like regulatory domain-containing protein n=1 Tax=Mucilaginibacter psychrotolerans TaxID=1524096 RepID=A0A4Y8SKG5_9SPHI|nr:DUF5686 and carboxypeptidase-like regulatory domain-containing protein [Mucilaginibacter psychrotolerans]TFF39150.1 carboxypeptidase-like regulatory domain-containing protein [Mucilaginibacter psychrotolerans]
MKTIHKQLYKSTLLLLLLLTASIGLRAQNTVVKGTITDAKTHKPMPYVTVTFAGSTIGGGTNTQGRYSISTTEKYNQIQVTFVGFKTATRTIEAGKEQEINIALIEDNQTLSEVVVKSGKKKKYTNKDNPAVELIRKVIAHKSQNQLENYNFAEYKQYERMSFSLSNLSEKFKNKRIFKNYQFLFREQDSTLIGGKTLLPLYQEEKLSDNYYRKSPYAKKQVISANKQVKYDESFVDNQGLTTYFNRMYQDINIYDNNVSLLSNQLLSPIADHSPDFYKFFITDTLKDQKPNLIELSFTPRNTNGMLFEGRIYITMDGNYAVQNAVLTVNKNINLNFVRQMQATLAFEKNNDGKYHLSQSDLKIDFGINKNKGGGVFGERLVSINNFVVNSPRTDDTYKGPAQVLAANADEKDDTYWLMTRPDTLDAAAASIYKNIDSLQTIPSFKKTMDIATLVLAGYKNYGKFEVGPANTFYSFNPVEGFRLRLGGRSTPQLSKRYYFETYGAYGTKDKEWKYFLSSTYSINNKSIYSFPQNYIRASFQHDTKVPGQELQFVQESSVLLSFKRGANDIWLYNDIFRLDYVHEFSNHLSYTIGFKKWNQDAAGALRFQNLLPNGNLNDVGTIHTSELSAQLRWAPHEKFYQGKLYRTPIPDKYPIFTLNYAQGVKGLAGGDYNYQNVTANITKRFYLSQLGFTDVSTEGGYLFGQVPFPLLDIHHANQSYAFQLYSYNLMNFQEFVSDHYASVTIDHNFNGFLFNRVPLLKKLKLREIIDFKALWGGVRSENDPTNNANLLRFPSGANGGTYALGSTPYIEGSIAVGNIFKLLRIDLVKRFTYLDNPGVSQYGVRAFVKFDF